MALVPVWSGVRHTSALIVRAQLDWTILSVIRGITLLQVFLPKS
jgi:hypothetical protein